MEASVSSQTNILIMNSEAETRPEFTVKFIWKEIITKLAEEYTSGTLHLGQWER